MYVGVIWGYTEFFRNSVGVYRDILRLGVGCLRV